MARCWSFPETGSDRKRRTVWNRGSKRERWTGLCGLGFRCPEEFQSDGVKAVSISCGTLQRAEPGKFPVARQRHQFAHVQPHPCSSGSAPGAVCVEVHVLSAKARDDPRAFVCDRDLTSHANCSRLKPSGQSSFCASISSQVTSRLW